MPDVPEDYYYSSLEAEEIEDRLLHVVTYHETMHLSDDEKALFRTNIGAGTTNTGLIILGYFDTLEDLRESLTVLPKAGDAYGIGTSAPYDIYIYDGYHAIWINNGPLNPGGTTFDDNTVSSSKGWTSNKIFTELASKQATLTFDSVPTSGSTKPVTSGGVYTAIAGIPKYSPLANVTNANYSIVASDAGKTLAPEYSTLRNVAVTFTLPQSVSASFPVGAEIAFFWQHSSSLKLAFSGGAKCAKAGDTSFTQNISYNFPEMYSMVAIKKTGSASAGDFWILQGNVEVVS